MGGITPHLGNPLGGGAYYVRDFYLKREAPSLKRLISTLKFRGSPPGLPYPKAARTLGGG